MYANNTQARKQALTPKNTCVSVGCKIYFFFVIVSNKLQWHTVIVIGILFIRILFFVN